MQSMQRSFGKLLSKGPGDNAKVSALVYDYEDVDKVLAKIIDSTMSWRDSWIALVGSQLHIVTEYEGLYDPIVGASDGHGQSLEPTPDLQLHRSYNLKNAYSELKIGLMEEIGMIEDQIVKPATDARDSINPIRKTIKKRENKRLDYDKAQEKYTKLYRKPGRSVKEDAALAKAQEEMSRANDEFGVADDHLRQTLPPIITAVFSLVPHLHAAHILIQNRLLGLYYTSLHGYCEENGFPSPPPPMEEVVAAWNAAFKPVQGQVESIGCIARGKAAHQPMGEKKCAIAVPLGHSYRRSSSSLIASTTHGPAPRNLRVPSAPALQASALLSSSPGASPTPSPNLGPKRPDYLAPTDFTTATMLGGGHVDRTSRAPSPNSQTPLAFTTPTSSHGASLVHGLVKKKPPPPPPKRKPSMRPEEWVVALYSFSGEGEGDLSFREGDRIRIVKKTETDQDWWVGELNGSKGSFPANYCRSA